MAMNIQKRFKHGEHGDTEDTEKKIESPLRRIIVMPQQGTDMEWIAALGKQKRPLAAFMAGLTLGIPATWTVATKVHEERITIQDMARAELQRQIAIQDKKIEQKDMEIKTLSAKLSGQSLAASSHLKSSAELQKFIAQLDAEIAKKKVELSRNAGLSSEPFSDSGRHETQKSDEYVRIDQELQALNEQRNAARQRQVDSMSK